MALLANVRVWGNLTNLSYVLPEIKTSVFFRPFFNLFVFALSPLGYTPPPPRLCHLTSKCNFLGFENYIWIARLMPSPLLAKSCETFGLSQDVYFYSKTNAPITWPEAREPQPIRSIFVWVTKRNECRQTPRSPSSDVKTSADEASADEASSDARHREGGWVGRSTIRHESRYPNIIFKS